MHNSLTRIKTLQDEIRADIVWFERARPKDQPAIRAAGLKKLEKLATLTKSDERILLQYIFAMRISFGEPDSPYSPNERLRLLLEALHLTVPNCDLEELSLGLYSLDETSLINQIANIYIKMGELNKALDIYLQILKYVQKHYQKMPQYGGNYVLIAHNYTVTLFIAERYNDALESANLGLKACIKYVHYRFLPGFLDLLGGCYFYKGNLEKYKEYYQNAYSLYKVLGNERDRLNLEKAAKNRLNLEFPF